VLGLDDDHDPLRPEPLVDQLGDLGREPLLELRPAREASFGQVYEALRAVRQARVRAALLLPSVPPARAVPPTAAPAVPPAPVNQAAPAPGGNAAR
jgi:hypothetical protein